MKYYGNQKNEMHREHWERTVISFKVNKRYQVIEVSQKYKNLMVAILFFFFAYWKTKNSVQSLKTEK